MKILSDKMKDGGKRRRVVLELDKDEQLVAIRDKSFYKLGYPIEDVVSSHVLTDEWCCGEQLWL